ncbi:heavy-metal-associated domain-containing protein [Echinicola strongylocentroti]|uniref:Heavy-metal-associated domain-containing protein n=1 Tax=Echinicola strongylocentroti TaxID=1795355 RepID=A0A2Z4IM05_9BACT|nr:heavy-metal-associated domain-containing protein [Echinicola strongylocentroti]AWW31924.1 heavy-metal-associated domain-containing protein [Echinicola strongylocentroti]
MIKKIIIGAGVVVLLLVATLAVHIYMVTSSRPDGPNWAMSQIDFNEDLDSLKSEKIKTDLLAIEGMREARINTKSDFIILLYDRKQHNPHDLVKQVNTGYEIQASLFQPSEDQLAASCPAINKNSLTYKLGSYFEQVFTN